MKKMYLFIVTVVLFTLPVMAQKVNGIVKGVLQDSTTATPLSDATVSVTSLRDSSLVSFSLTSRNGNFEIKNLEAGDYLLVSSFSGLQTKKTKFTISAENQTADLGIIKMDRFYKSMSEIIISDDAPVKINGDTLAFKADAFKTKPNATVEDLLKKMPGMQVDRDGSVKAQGEQVQKVYVDGKEFFGTDPKLATKNLTADMIDQVEVFDDMSEQAKFNKIDDGSRSKAINLKLKKEKKKGVFGKAYGAYGTDDHYDAGVTANIFKGATQTSVIAKANNTNNIGFTVSDMTGMFGGGGNMGGGNVMMMGRGGSGGSGGLNLGSTGSGLTSSSQIGINYRDTWSKSFDVTGSYFFNRTRTTNLSHTLRQTFAGDTTYFNDQLRNSLAENDNHRFNLNMTYRIDSLNSIIYSPSISFQNSTNNYEDTIAYYFNHSGGSQNQNESRSINTNNGDAVNWTNNLIWRKRFMRPGRTLSVSLNNTMNDNDRVSYNIIRAIFNSKNINTNSESSIRNYSAGFSYTEPLSRNKVIEFNYNYSRNTSHSDRQTLAYDTTSGKYDQEDAALSNKFANLNESHRAGANFRVVQKKYNYQIGFAVQQTLLESDNISKDILQSQKFLNMFPTANFNYQFARSKNLRFNYRGSTRQPSITQLQEVVDISNAPFLYKGNASLRQEFSNNINISYNFFDVVKFRNVFAFVMFNNTYNRISNSVTINPDGTQLTVPVNLNGYYMVSGNFNFGLPIKRMKGGNFNTTSRISLSQDPSLYKSQKNYTKNLNIGEDLRLNYNYKEKLDMGITASINYNSVHYSNPGQSSQNEKYFTHTYSADITYTFPKNFILASDFDYTFNTGRTDGFNRNYAMWNGSFAKGLFKNKRGELKASVFDILNQNTSVVRNVGSNYIEDVRNTTLQRFFMLSFTYRINRMGGKSMPSNMQRVMRDMRF